MNLLIVCTVIIIAGILLFLVNKFVPMDAKVKTILNWVVIILLIIWLVKGFGLLTWLGNVTV